MRVPSPALIAALTAGVLSLGGGNDIAYPDWTFSWSAGGGLLVRLKHAAFLDLGLHYVRNATVNWLAEGDLAWDGNSVTRVAAHRTPANLVEITIGVTLSAR